MLVNTHEVFKSNNKVYLVFWDTSNDCEEFIETEDANSEFENY